ncbi:TPA: autotransporter domain-containing protein, partial [Salmonella enterica subsp. enterica serovar Choleraesuis]|nr:autotransporter domain-containing protein [Salmonella enterica subsp. enterica serovar Choleraesuis]
VITLTADDGVTGQADELVGMAALNGGVVINDTSGVINIDSDYGQAFLSDSSSYIINNGSINLNGSPMDDTDSHMGGTPTDKIWIQSLPGSGDSDTRTSDTGFFTAGTLANYGTETLNGDVDVNGGWLYNEAGASLTVNGTVTINGGANALANYGTLDADAISTWHSLFNEADGSITTDLLTLNGDVTFYNNGDFTGSIAGTSYQQEIVNTGDMTVAEDGKSLVSGSFYFYNEEDATLTNSGSAVEGGENTIINLTRANDSLTQVNSGTITATNGYSAITTVNGSNDPKWIWNTATGVINVYADDSYAFGGTTKAIINNGEINLLCDSGCDIYAPGTTGTQNDHNGTADIAIPDATTAPTEGSIPTPPEDPNAPQQLSNYIVGTNADGSSGTLKANNLVIGDNVKVDTGFTSGTADTTVVVDNAFTGSNIQGADNITSTSVVWNAQGSQDADGNVDVTMTKNAYADVATDSSVSDVAQALDAGYTNNELYTSLNVGTTAELNSALKQVNGAQATTVFREARVLSNRFTMLADAAPQIKDGLAFNVVAKGDPRAELGNDTQYDMLALRQTLDLTASQNLTLEYGIARLDGDGSKTAGDNGLTGGYSQFFGLKHSMAFDEGLAWNNSLRYDVHNLDSSRSVAYGDVNKIADSDMRQQYLEFRSEGAKTFTMMGNALKVTPYAGVKFRHTMEDGYKERSAGDFNLSMNSGNETAVDSIVGLKLDYAGKDGWSATATLEGGPNLSYSKSQRTASLQGAAGQSFGVDDGQKGGGVNGLATIGVKYSSNDTALHLDAYQWKEDGISDKGFMLNVKKTFR